MADSIREQIIAAFETRAATLSSEPVTRARRSAIVGDDRFVSIWDGEDVAVEKKYNVQKLEFPIAIEAIWLPSDTNPSVSANAVMAEIVATMLKDVDRTFGGLALKTELSTATPSYPVEGGELVTVTVIFNITYQTIVGDPYTKP